MLYGCWINGDNTKDEWGLVLAADVKIDAPEKKTNYVDIPGADGSLDMSDYPQGRPTYKNRNISFTLFKRTNEVELDEIRTGLRQLYHGKRVRLVLPNDTEHYFSGVMSIGNASGYHSCIIPVSMTADPYKLRLDPTEVVVAVSGSRTVQLQNENKPVCPTISTDAEVTIYFGDSSVTLSAGNNQTIPSFILEGGYTAITLAGNATVTFKYQEGTL